MALSGTESFHSNSVKNGNSSLQKAVARTNTRTEVLIPGSQREKLINRCSMNVISKAEPEILR